MLALFAVTTPSEQIRFWDISRTKTTETPQVSKANTRKYTYKIRGFMSLNDAAASETSFQALIELGCAVFRSKPTLDGAAVDASPLQVDNVTHVEVGGILCHMAECSIVVEEDISFSE